MATLYVISSLSTSNQLLIDSAVLSIETIWDRAFNINYMGPWEALSEPGTKSLPSNKKKMNKRTSEDSSGPTGNFSELTEQ